MNNLRFLGWREARRRGIDYRRKRPENMLIAQFALNHTHFAIALNLYVTHTDQAFQASSPKTSRPSFGAAFFLPYGIRAIQKPSP